MVIYGGWLTNSDDELFTLENRHCLGFEETKPLV